MNPAQLQHKSYFSLGIDSRYALINMSDRRVWLLLDNLDLAHALRQLFVSKLALAVFDIQGCTNRNQIGLDNLCCLQWQVPPDVILQNGLFRVILNGAFNGNHVLQHDLEQNHDIGKSIIDRSRMHDVQYQMMLALKLLPLCSAHVMPDIKKIFETNLSLEDLEQQLIQYAWQNLMSEKVLSAQIITSLEALYD